MLQLLDMTARLKEVAEKGAQTATTYVFRGAVILSCYFLGKMVSHMDTMQNDLMTLKLENATMKTQLIYLRAEIVQMDTKVERSYVQSMRQQHDQPDPETGR